MTPTQAHALRAVIDEAASIELSLRGSKRANDVTWQMAHLVEELGEMFKCFREDQWDSGTEQDHFGLAHPTGLASEAADVLGVALILIRAVEQATGINVVEATIAKQDYLRAKAAVKVVEGRSPSSRFDHLLTSDEW